jgi:hypothetical protein
VIDSKQYRGRLQLDPTGRLARPLPLAPILRAVSFEADQAAQVLPDPGLVVPIVAVHVRASGPCPAIRMTRTSPYTS